MKKKTVKFEKMISLQKQHWDSPKNHNIFDWKSPIRLYRNLQVLLNLIDACCFFYLHFSMKSTKKKFKKKKIQNCFYSPKCPCWYCPPNPNSVRHSWDLHRFVWLDVELGGWAVAVESATNTVNIGDLEIPPTLFRNETGEKSEMKITRLVFTTFYTRKQNRLVHSAVNVIKSLATGYTLHNHKKRRKIQIKISN